MSKKIDIWDILRRRYPATEYALMAEVSDKAGFNRSRSADYVVVNLWPSRGLEIYGIELKSFRSDWLSELKKPQKAENIFQYCDRFYLLTTDDTVAKLEEIPPTWGWMCLTGSRIKVMKEAPKLQPANVSKNFLACLLKRAQDKTSFVHVDSIEDRIKEAKESAKQERALTIERHEKTIRNQEKIISDFQNASGMSLTAWNSNPVKMGQAVRFLTDGGTSKIMDDLLDLEKSANKVLSNIQVSLEEFKKITTGNPGIKICDCRLKDSATANFMCHGKCEH